MPFFHDTSLRTFPATTLAVPTALEQHALASFVPLATLFDCGEQAGPADPAPPANQRHLIRQSPCAGSPNPWHGKIGMSANGAWLIFSNELHLYMVPMEHVLGFELLRLSTVAGTGSAFLMIACRRPQAQPLLFTIVKRRAPDALTPLSRRLAASLALPLLIHPVEAAC